MNDYIGATGNFYINDYIDYTSNINFIYTSNSSNYLNKRIDDIDIETSNISSNISDIYSNNLRDELWDINPNNNLCLIKYKTYSGIPHNYVINSNINGEIRFSVLNSYATNSEYPYNYSVKIDNIGKLMIYHKFIPLQPLFPQAWYDVEGELFALKNEVAVVINPAIAALGAFQTSAINQISLLQALTGAQQYEIQSIVAVINAITANDEIALINGIQSFDGARTLFGNFVQRISTSYTATATTWLGSAFLFGVPLMLNSAADYMYREHYKKLVDNFSNAYIPSFTTEERRILYSCNDDGYQTSFNDFYSNSCNLGIYQGFINCNITNQQFIPNFWTSSSIGIGTNSPLNSIHIHTPLTNINQSIQFTNGNTGNNNTDGFQINQLSSGDCQIINNENANLILGTNGIERIRINGSGNVGIDKTPSYKLDVNGNINGTEIYRSGVSLASTLGTKQDNITVSAPITKTINNLALSYDSSLTLSGNNLKVADASASKWTTTSGNNIYNNNVGNVGIGLITPTHKLDVNGNINGTEIYRSGVSLATTLGTKQDNITVSAPITKTINNLALSYDSSLTLSGNNLKVADASASKWTTTSGNNIYNNNVGNVGIGLITPTHKLDVNGNIYGRNNLYIGNSTPIISSYTNASINNISGTDDKYLTYTTNGTLVLNDILNCEIFMIGGGGGGGYNHGGGGGAGAYYRGTQTLNAGSYSISIGAGGTQDNSGGNTIISLGATNILIVNGGGKGGSFNSPYTGANGGCGGGGTGWNNNLSTNTTWAGGSAVNTGTNGSGFAGGFGRNNYNGNTINGGGGGGIGGVGADAPIGTTGTGAAGGNALNIDITGVNVVYGGGGGGGVWGDGTKTITGGLGGGVGSTYVGGQGGKTTAQAGGNGVANTGSGGGGGGPAFGVGGTGGAGIVIIRFTETGKIGIGTSIPNNKLHIEKGSVFIGDNSIGNGTQIDNNYKLIFDSSYTSDGTNKCNKIILHKNLSGITYLGGIGVEAGGIVYSTWTGARHRFYTETTNTSGGILSFEISKDNFNFYNNVDGASAGYVRNTSAGSGAHCIIGMVNNTGSFGGLFLNSSARTADGGANNMTIRNDAGDLILSAKSSTPQIFLQESTDRIYMNGLVNIRQGSGGGAYAVPTNYMQDGSLTIGSTNLNYGLGTGGWSTNTAGLLLECYDNTEIAVHDAGQRLTSLIAYQGGTSYNTITIGRDMGAGWGTAWNVNFAGAKISLANEWYILKGTTPTSVPNSLIFLHSTTNLTSRWWLHGTQDGTNSEISDERIKKEINDIDNALEKLLLIKPKEYYLCSDKDYNKKYGVIAQDINKEESLKHLIYTDKEYIANLLTNAKFIKEKIGEEEPILEYPEDKYIKSEENPTPYQRPKPKEIFKYTITTDKNLNGLINIDDELKIVLDNNDIDNIEIIIDDTPYNNRYKKRFIKVKEIIDDYSFEIYEDIDITETEKDNLFIYGKKVNDFLKLDYQSLYCLNIKATQELIIKNLDLEKRLKRLEDLIIKN